MSNILEIPDFGDIVLTDSYRGKGYKRHFDQHLNSLLNTSVEITQDYNRESILDRKDISINDALYWEVENYILETLDDTSPEVDDELFKLEDTLKSKIINSLGNLYDRSDVPLRLMIDNTVQDTLLSFKFELFSEKDRYQNPWDPAKKILFEDNVLYMFSSSSYKLKELGFNVKDSNKNESELLKDKKINIVAKGKKKGYAYDYVRDLLALRNIVFNIIKDKSQSGEKSIKSKNIIDEVRKLGILTSELTDSQIRNWLITPLKRSSKIGSYKEGFFALDTCQDVVKSYNYHLENLKGYFRTLENHRRIAGKFGCDNDDFFRHYSIFPRSNEI